MSKIYTTSQVAKICKVAPRTVSKWFDSGRLRGYRIPGSQDRRIPHENLLRFLAEHGFMDTLRDLESPPLPTLEQYLRNAVEVANIIDFSIRASVAEDGRVTFYIHPDGRDGDTADFEVDGNSLTRNRDVQPIEG